MELDRQFPICKDFVKEHATSNMLSCNPLKSEQQVKFIVEIQIEIEFDNGCDSR